MPAGFAETKLGLIINDDGSGTSGTAIDRAQRQIEKRDNDRGVYADYTAAGVDADPPTVNPIIGWNGAGLLLGPGGAGALDALLKRIAAAKLAVRNVGDTADGDLAAANLDLSGYVDIAENATPPNPPANVARTYAKHDGGVTRVYFRDSGGVETLLAGAARVLGRTAASTGKISVSVAPTVSRLLMVWNSVETDTDGIGIELKINDVGGTSYQWALRSYGVGDSGIVVADGQLAAAIKVTSGGAANLGSAGGEITSGWAWITEEAANIVMVRGCAVGLNSGNDIWTTDFGGTVDLTSALVSVQLSPSAGNLDSGEVIVYEVIEA